MHTRMDDNTANVEITNPMFGGDDFDDDIAPHDGLSNQPFAIDVDDKVCFQLSPKSRELTII